jgi:hypothetical protein
VLSLVKRLSKAICCYLCSRDIYKLNLAILNSVLNIVIVRLVNKYKVPNNRYRLGIRLYRLQAKVRLELYRL